MSTRDSRGRDLPPQPPLGTVPPDGEQLPPQAPIISRQVPTGRTRSDSATPPQQQPVAHPGGAMPPAVPLVPTSVAPPAETLPQLETAATAHATQPAGHAHPDDEEMDLRETIEEWRQKIVVFFTQFALPNAPPWMLSTMVHLVIIVIAALIMLPEAVKSNNLLQVTYAEELGEQLLDDTPYLESIEPVEIDPALAFDAKEVNDPLASAEMPLIQLDLFNAATFEAPTIGVALSGREPGAKKAMLAAYGGTGETESAVETALSWLKRNQQPDGSWSLAGPYADGVAGTENPLAATAMALLAFQGAGNTHRTGEYKATVKKAIDALLKMQDRDGCFFTMQRVQSSHQLYSQAQATIAVCELYTMTEDSSLRDPAQRAIDYACSIQANDGLGGGGWRYQPGKDVDTSVTGWFVIALKSGEFGKLSVPSPALERISRYLDNVAASPGESEQFPHGSRYLYRVGERDQRLSMTAEALLCRQYLGWDHSDPRLLSGVRYVGENPIDWDAPHVYYWYYATQLMHHMGGEDWDDWNGVMRKALPAAQIKTGREAGSWSPAGDQFGYTGGRLFMTCLCTYMLEVYYRHMPIYQH